MGGTRLRPPGQRADFAVAGSGRQVSADDADGRRLEAGGLRERQFKVPPAFVPARRDYGVAGVQGFK